VPLLAAAGRRICWAFRLIRPRACTRLDSTDADIDAIENVSRCGSYFRVREAIKSAAAKM
jgi:aerobic-type carbon monoxide dehydrogenase small subunit (CoxS/CutS family)